MCVCVDGVAFVCRFHAYCWTRYVWALYQIFFVEFTIHHDLHFFYSKPYVKHEKGVATKLFSLLKNKNGFICVIDVTYQY